MNFPSLIGEMIGTLVLLILGISLIVLAFAF